MRPLIETVLASLFLALGPFLYFFGVKGFVLFGLPLVHMPPEWQDPSAAASLVIGAFIAASLRGGYPDWLKPLGVLTGALLVGEGVLSFVV